MEIPPYNCVISITQRGKKTQELFAFNLTSRKKWCIIYTTKGGCEGDLRMYFTSLVSATNSGGIACKRIPCMFFGA